MRKPKRLRFVPGARAKSDYQRAVEGLRMIADAVQPVVVGLTGAFNQMHRVVEKLVNLGEALLADPEFQ